MLVASTAKAINTVVGTTGRPLGRSLHLRTPSLRYGEQGAQWSMQHPLRRPVCLQASTASRTERVRAPTAGLWVDSADVVGDGRQRRRALRARTRSWQLRARQPPLHAPAGGRRRHLLAVLCLLIPLSVVGSTFAGTVLWRQVCATTEPRSSASASPAWSWASPRCGSADSRRSAPTIRAGHRWSAPAAGVPPPALPRRTLGAVRQRSRPAWRS